MVSEIRHCGCFKGNVFLDKHCWQICFGDTSGQFSEWSPVVKSSRTMSHPNLDNLPKFMYTAPWSNSTSSMGFELGLLGLLGLRTEAAMGRHVIWLQHGCGKANLEGSKLRQLDLSVTFLSLHLLQGRTIGAFLRTTWVEQCVPWDRLRCFQSTWNSLKQLKPDAVTAKYANLSYLLAQLVPQMS